MTYGSGNSEESGVSSECWLFLPLYFLCGEGMGQSRAFLLHFSTTVLFLTSETGAGRRKRVTGKDTTKQSIKKKTQGKSWFSHLPVVGLRTHKVHEPRLVCYYGTVMPPPPMVVS